MGRSNVHRRIVLIVVGCSVALGAIAYGVYGVVDPRLAKPAYQPVITPEQRSTATAVVSRYMAAVPDSGAPDRQALQSLAATIESKPDYIVNPTDVFIVYQYYVAAQNAARAGELLNTFEQLVDDQHKLVNPDIAGQVDIPYMQQQVDSLKTATQVYSSQDYVIR